LLFNTTRDGFDPENFHHLCDNKGATLTIAKLCNSHQIIGGYNPVNWKSADEFWLETFDSFIFSFFENNDSYGDGNRSDDDGNHNGDYNSNNNNNSSSSSNCNNRKEKGTTTIARVYDSNKAIFYNVRIGPGFGGGPDLYIKGNLLIGFHSSTYPDIEKITISSQAYEIEKYEVFQVIQKKY